ncbi:MAG: adenylate/guanylate cyclase domain-containing protein [Candidatus Woesearchaeota archaeon]
MAYIREHSEILTVMFIDIVGYTKTTAQLSREEFTQMHDTFDNMSIPIFERYGGKVIKKIGDAFLVTFKSPTNAVLCGVELQNVFDHYNKTAKRPIRIRVAIHTGEVIIRKDDVYGEAVNTASRIESVAGSGQIVFSEAVFSAMNKREVPYIHLGLHKLKGMKYPIRLFRVKSAYDEILRRRRAIASFFKKLILIGIIALIAYLLVAHILPYLELF